MGNIVVLTPNELALRIKRDQKGSPAYVLKALQASAEKAKAYLITKSPVDRGFLRLAWRVVVLSKGEVTLVNDQPYAGVIENGARPFKISQAGREAIRAWVLRKIQSGQFSLKPVRDSKGHFKKQTKTLEQQAESISWAIAKTFEKRGIKGRKFVYKNFDRLVRMINKEMDKSLDAFFSRGKDK